MIIPLSPVKGQPHFLVTANSVNEVKEHFSKVDKESLIFFDIDSTLTTPSDPYLRRHAIKKHKSIYDNLIAALTPNQKRIFNHLLVINSPSQLVEEEWSTFIKELQEKDIKILALTAAKTGSINSVIKSFPDWRYNELVRLGINFSLLFPGAVLFKNLEDFGGDFPGIEKGIVYCGHQASKGDLIFHVLEVINFMPTLIILVDDKKENIESLSNALHKLFPSISFIGIHYRGMFFLEKPFIEEKVFHKKFYDIVNKTKKISS